MTLYKTPEAFKTANDLAGAEFYQIELTLRIGNGLYSVREWHGWWDKQPGKAQYMAGTLHTEPEELPEAKSTFIRQVRQRIGQGFESAHETDFLGGNPPYTIRLASAVLADMEM